MLGRRLSARAADRTAAVYFASTSLTDVGAGAGRVAYAVSASRRKKPENFCLSLL
jgi:hypothetical protein